MESGKAIKQPLQTSCSLFSCNTTLQRHFRSVLTLQLSKDSSESSATGTISSASLPLDYCRNNQQFSKQGTPTVKYIAEMHVCLLLQYL